MDQTVPLPDYEPLFRLSTENFSLYLTILLSFCGAVFFLRSRSEAAYNRFSLVVYWAAAISVLGSGYISVLTANMASDAVISGIRSLSDAGNPESYKSLFGPLTAQHALESAYKIQAYAEAVLHISASCAVLILVMWVTAYVAEGIFDEGKPASVEPKPGENDEKKSG